MKRSLLISHADDQQIQAKKKRQKHDDDISNDVSRTESKGHTKSKSNDGRLCLLSLVCNQQLSTNKEKVPRVKPQVQGNPTKIPQEGDSEEMNNEGLSKNAQQVLGILSPVIVSLSEGENANQRPALIRCEEESKLNKKATTTTTFSNDEEEERTKEANNPIMKEVFRPIPLPPRLPMVPAGHIFPLARFPTRNWSALIDWFFIHSDVSWSMWKRNNKQALHTSASSKKEPRNEWLYVFVSSKTWCFAWALYGQTRLKRLCAFSKHNSTLFSALAHNRHHLSGNNICHLSFATVIIMWNSILASQRLS